MPTATGRAPSLCRPRRFTAASTRTGRSNKSPTSAAKPPANTASLMAPPGEIGLIAPVTQPFCGHCSRIRLTADGKLRTCLFSKDDHDLRALLREGASDNDLVTYISSMVMEKEKGHQINEPGFLPPSRTMVFIGG